MKNTYQNQRLVCVSAIGIIAIAFTAANIFSGITQAHRAVVADQQVSASSCALQTFSPVANLSAGTLPVAVAAADFNADGKVDFAVANFGSNNVSVYLNSGTGAFAAPVNYAVGNNPSSIVAADFNADGKMDLAVTESGADQVLILFGNGKGGFTAGGSFFVGANPSGIAAGDFNADGKMDLAVANTDTDDISILLGNGNGTFRPTPNISVGSTPLALVVADFNGDGKADLGVADYDDDNLAILLGNGSGGFVAPAYVDTDTNPVSLVAGDFNGDGKIDLAVANEGADDVTVFSGNGSGGFAAPTTLDVGADLQAIAKGDFNGDGKLDLVIANGLTDDISVLLNNGSGGFYSPMTFGTDITPIAFAVADLDSDGKLDLVIPNSDSNDVSILMNTCGAATVLNPIDDPTFFVSQHYLDFLNRDPDAVGVAFWTNQITSCGADSACTAMMRVNTSAAFYLSIEFQQTGYLVYRTYGAAFGTTRIGGTVPLTFAEFLPDVQQVGNGVVVGATGWETQLEANKVAYFDAFVTRPAFTTLYPNTLTYAQYVDALNANTGGALSSSKRDQLVTSLTNGMTRAQVLRSVVEDDNFSSAQFNKAFVLMQYFGYLRRDPNSGPDTNFDGYNFWLTKLNQFNGNYNAAEMVKAFITSSEYRQRFGP
jgi:hypothetical protein